MAKAKKASLGTWKVARQGENQVVVTLPAGMKITGNDIKMEDLVSAIVTYQSLKKGRIVLLCCSGNMAIA